jgi:hypothetical protein
MLLYVIVWFAVREPPSNIVDAAACMHSLAAQWQTVDLLLTVL